ncbi:MAG: hypothetical protein IPI90_17575 [Saprospiraceae bacterium]|nr:hypothetical protein [Candidatus Vicinibacter affinis]
MALKVNLKEYIYPKMNLLFVALNAPEVSNANAHWFSYNLSFWNLLFRAGVITQTISDPKEGDVKVFGSNKINYRNWIIGVTDLNRDVVATKSTQVTTDSTQVKRILSIIENNAVKRICLMHSMVTEEFERNGIIVRNNKTGVNAFGIVGKYKSTVIYEAPFHSGNSIPNKEIYYSKLIS